MAGAQSAETRDCTGNSCVGAETTGSPVGESDCYDTHCETQPVLWLFATGLSEYFLQGCRDTYHLVDIHSGLKLLCLELDMVMYRNNNCNECALCCLLFVLCCSILVTFM